MKFIIGKKIGMSQLFDEQERIQPITLIQAGPCYITAMKKQEKDGYSAVQLGFMEKKAKKNAAAKKSNAPRKKFQALREFRNLHQEYKQEASNIDGKDLVAWAESFKLGDVIDASVFELKDRVDIRGTVKGRGFQGVVKRHRFAGGRASHGHTDVERKAGTVGQRFPQHTRPGRRMAGRMGGNHATMKNLEILWIDKEAGVIAIKGSVPGNNNSFVEIWTSNPNRIDK